MRKILIVTVLFMYHGFFAQTHFSYHSTRNVAYGGVSLANAVYHVETVYDLCCRTGIYLNKSRNTAVEGSCPMGNIVAKDFTPLIDATADQHLVVLSATNTGVCDSYSQPAPKICKVDTSGVTKWTVPVNSKTVTHLLALGDSSIVFAAGNKLYRINEQGLFTDTLAAGIGTIQSLCRFNKDSFLVNHLTGAGPNIRKISNKLNSGADVLVGTTNEKMQVLGDGSLVALAGGKLIRYDKTFVWLGNSDGKIAPASAPVKNFMAAGDTIYCSGNDLNSNDLHYWMLHKSFTPLFHSTPNLKYLEPRNISLTNNKVNIIATSPGSASNSNSFTDLIQMPKKGQPVKGKCDVGVSSATAIAESLGQTYVKVNASLRIKNYGTEPVHSFRINFNRPIGPGVNWCWDSGFSTNVNQVLNPGDSLTIDSIIFYTIFWNDLCFYTTIPNNSHDIDPTNDNYCLPTLVVGTKEITETSGLKIFPNPGNNELNIESEVPMSSFEITNVNGQLLLSKPIAGEIKFRFVHDLPPGIYLVTIRSGQKTVTEKLVVTP